MKILFTRHIDFTYKQTLQQAGFEVLEYDFLKTRALSHAKDTILNEIHHIKNLVFTSKNAVKIFFETLTEAQLSKSFKLLESYLASGVKIFSTSGATKDLIEKYGISPTLSADSAKELAYLMLEKADLSQGVHFLCGTISLPYLPNILSENGVSVKKITVYETIMTPLSSERSPMDIGVPSDSILEPFEAIVFLSLSAAESFLKENSLPSPIPVFTLGKTTADYVRENTDATNIFVAEKPTIAALVHCSCEFIRNIKRCE